MRKSFSWICGILAALASQPSGALTSAAASEPDFNLAYVLATASYCAYAVGAIDSGGEKLADQGRKRAFDCLTAAVEADPSHLDALRVEAADVEAYFSPAKPQNAYLLIHAKNGVILAFRGTLTPPISPGKASRNGLVKEAIENYNADVLKGFESYLRDWVNNVVAFANERHRHAGFDASWQELKEPRGDGDLQQVPVIPHANAGCCSRSTPVRHGTQQGRCTRHAGGPGHAGAHPASAQNHCLHVRGRQVAVAGGREERREIAGRVWPWMQAAIAAGALINGYTPPNSWHQSWSATPCGVSVAIS